MASADTSLLGTFQKHIEDMRNLSLCKICIKPFYEPFILACGHTYCYSCLASWFAGPHNRGKAKNCPDCRAVVTIEPSPNYLLRDLVHMFIGRAELLPQDETVEEHQEAKQIEAQLLAADRIDQHLFKGVFARRNRYWNRRPGLVRSFGEADAPIRDAEDNVMRCPRCAWELEDGECLQCGWDPDFGSETDMETEDSAAERGSISSGTSTRSMSPNYLARHHHFHGLGPEAIGRYAGSALSDDPDDLTEGYDASSAGTPHLAYATMEEDEDMSSFIDDDEDLPNEDDEDDRSVQTLRCRGPNIPYESETGLSATDEEGNESDQVIRRPPHLQFYGVNFSSQSGSSSEDETNTQTSIQDDGDVQSTNDNEDESEDDSIQEIPNPAITRISRQRRIVDSDEDDDDSASSNDTAIRPPQPSASRRQRLDTQRARRGGHLQNGRHNTNPYQAPQYADRGRYGRGRATQGMHTARRSRPYAARVH